MILALCLLLSTAFTSEACSPVGFPPSADVLFVMHSAPIVLLGNAKSQTNDTYDVTFEVHCVLKSSEEIGSEIVISGMYYFHSCTTTSLTVGNDYLIALKPREGGMYDTFEYNIASSAAYTGDDIDLDAVMKVCGFDAPVLPEGAANSEACPAVAADNSECSVPTPPVEDENEAVLIDEEDAVPPAPEGGDIIAQSPIEEKVPSEVSDGAGDGNTESSARGMCPMVWIVCVGMAASLLS